MVAILGPPPPAFLGRSQASWTYFKRDGGSKSGVAIPDVSMETLAKRLEGEDKSMFLDFLRKMLGWDPEKRQTARQLLEDPWLVS